MPLSIGTIIAVLLVAGAATAGITYVMSRLFRTVPWQPLPHPPIGLEAVRYFGPVDGDFLANALLTVARLLANNVHGWSYAHVQLALSDAHVFVYSTPTFVGTGSKWVAGEQDGRHLYVGSDLASLCHEAAHRCAEVLDGLPAKDHFGWETNGIGAAIDIYHAWLKEPS